MIPHFEQLAKDRGLLLQATRTVSRVEAALPGAPLVREIENSMHMELHRMISENCVTREIMDYSVEFRLNLIIATPDQFYRLVQDEAMRYSSFANLQVKP